MAVRLATTQLRCQLAKSKGEKTMLSPQNYPTAEERADELASHRFSLLCERLTYLPDWDYDMYVSDQRAHLVWIARRHPEFADEMIEADLIGSLDVPPTGWGTMTPRTGWRPNWGWRLNWMAILRGAIRGALLTLAAVVTAAPILWFLHYYCSHAH
jgi:hypothetical protein